MSRGWWRRNALGLGALAVLLPATALTIGWTEWSTQLGTMATRAVVAGPDGVVEYAGALFGPAEAVRDDAPELGAPEGSDVIGVSIPVRPQGAGVGCSSPVLTELSGAGREWTDALYDLDWRTADARETFCPPDRADEYRIVVPFLVPDDAEGPFAVDLQSAEGLPGFARLPIDP